MFIHYNCLQKPSIFGGFSACYCLINKNIDLKREIYYNSIIKFIKRKEKI